MMYDFSADDIFEMAEKLEQNGATFYRNAAGQVADEASKAFLEGLAVMEDQHEETFKQMRAQLSTAEKQSTVFDPDGESALYLRALADTRVFFEKEIDLTAMKEILKSAIEAEKDSIVFYLGMRDMVPDEKGQKRLDAIIKEEMSHIRTLSQELVKHK